jgi:hypothetical protein
MTPRINETRKEYVARCKANHLAASEMYPKDNQSMWLQLLYYAMAEDIYGEHWDNLHKEKANEESK